MRVELTYYVIVSHIRDSNFMMDLRFGSEDEMISRNLVEKPDPCCARTLNLRNTDHELC